MSFVWGRREGHAHPRTAHTPKRLHSAWDKAPRAAADPGVPCPTARQRAGCGERRDERAELPERHNQRTDGPMGVRPVLCFDGDLPPAVGACGFQEGPYRQVTLNLNLKPPSSQGPPMVPPRRGPNILKRKSSWHRRRRSRTFGCQPQTSEGEGGGVHGEGVPPPLLLRCTAVLVHHCPLT